MYVVNHKQDPVALSIKAPRDWHIVNGRTEKKDQSEFQFANWDVMTDTPTEIAPDWTDDEFKVDGKTYHVVVHSLGKEAGNRPALVRDLEKIVRAETAMWGPPEFDSYTFLFHFANDQRSSDGMEHLTSTQIIVPGALADKDMLEETLDAAAHEFFHVWNVKRLRPIELGPWDFTRPANTRGLWIAEGITNYYGHLMQRRAGLWTDAKLFSELRNQISEVENSPGSKLMSAEESSLSAPFLDDAPHAQQTNLANISVSYYPKGEVVGLALDLLIRGKTNGQASLDTVMRRMYEDFYLKSPQATYYLRGRGYTAEDFEKVVSQVAGSDMSDFFKRHVRGVEPPPYEEAFAQVGLRFVRTARAPVTLGITADENDVVNFKIAAVRSGSPAAEAGLEVGDAITAFGGNKFTSVNFSKVLARYKPGERAQVSFLRGGRPATVHDHSGSTAIVRLQDRRKPECFGRRKDAKSGVVERKIVSADFLECADSSALWIVFESGDKSPHSKLLLHQSRRDHFRRGRSSADRARDRRRQRIRHVTNRKHIRNVRFLLSIHDYIVPLIEF
jgi:predicted metalloprotease with PDZ domain